ncbi:MAG: hypothetical protein Q9Q13_01740 [Acidobacteriota bacterium]|nr:hypothetical protein [Acidobacteriota bacterium]
MEQGLDERFERRFRADGRRGAVGQLLDAGRRAAQPRWIEGAAGDGPEEAIPGPPRRVEIVAEESHIGPGRQDGQGAVAVVAAAGKRAHTQVIAEDHALVTEALAQPAGDDRGGKAAGKAGFLEAGVGGVGRHHRRRQGGQFPVGVDVPLPKFPRVMGRDGQGPVGVGARAPQAGKMLETRGPARPGESLDHSPGPHHHPVGVGVEGPVADAVGGQALVQVDHRGEVQVDPHAGQQDADRLPGPLEAVEGPAGLLAGRGQGGEAGVDGGQAVDPSALEVDGHHQRPPGAFFEGADQVAQLGQGAEIAAEESDAAGPEVAEGGDFGRGEIGAADAGEKSS